MVDFKWSRPAIVFCGILSCGCERTDPLSAIPNSTGTAILEHKLIGSNSRAICVITTLREACNSRQSEIYIEDVEKPGDVTARWVNEKLVTIDIVSGTVRRGAERSRDGRTTIRLNRNASPRGITIVHPGGNETVPWTPPS